jgi:hypothetical protein
MCSVEQRVFICNAFAKYVSKNKCQKFCKTLAEEEKVKDNQHFLQELCGSIWLENAKISRQ